MDQADGDDERKHAIYQRLLEQLIKPQLRRLAEQIDGIEPEDLEDAQIDITQLDAALPDNFGQLSGEALFLSSQDTEHMQQVMRSIQQHMQEGLSFDYILQELTDVEIDSIDSSQLGNIRVNMVAVRPDAEGVAGLSPEQLRDMYER